ncbi:chemotaxis protein CheB [Fuerstiella marisgermanici]|uniref:Autoinducer 2 sensor kinase/phosphatase LuxQ n=1 Tax=Fuerstiella marisgermanici TaxID=1891926 RepID=A0A1P8WCP8_9PLAN|nr:chemotaxis protein CheB [Fuerstiella marisgermanici]APZ91833.1 Autoinducer 2 sensor kinase/phosphatase LuxQ [Fuerstiella marisgermanici]
MEDRQLPRSLSDRAEGADERCFVIGVGASAGGLEALESFFEHMPTDSGLAFVVVQHLSPDFKSHMDELLRRKTQIPVHLVEDGIEVRPDSIYLLPARMEMIISDGKLRLTERKPDRSFSHPIDQFFRSLAVDCGKRGVAIVLSGTGSDGAKGIREVYEAGGLTISQDEASAKFDGMPMSAQATGVVDLVLPPESMAEALMQYTRDGVAREDLAKSELSLVGIDSIFQQLNKEFGVDFSQYKETTVGRRLQRRLDRLSLETLDDYGTYLHEHPNELAELYRDLLICVTNFFRDSDAFRVLAVETIPTIFANTREGETVRVWVAACSTGEEAYTVAILLDEERRRCGKDVDFKVFATDLHPSSIQHAARGSYTAESLAPMSFERRTQYFRRDGAQFQVTPEIRRRIVFAPHNILSDAPFTQMDLVTCRNMLIYLQPAAQARALSLLHFSLKPGGTLFLGPSESPGEISDEFHVVNQQWRLFTKRRDLRIPLGTSVPLARRSTPGAPIVPTPNFGSMRVDNNMIQLYDELLDQKMGSSILVDRRGQILHVFGDAARFLRFSSGRPTAHVLEAVEGKLKASLSAALHHATRKHGAVQYQAVPFPTSEDVEHLQITVEPIGDPVTGSGNLLISIVAVDATDPDKLLAAKSELTDELVSDMTTERMNHLETELQQSQENLQATIEEMETSNEELQASNEELVASNEELQSTNEELHSVNEELHTVNAEHQRRVEELAEANADMDNLLATTHVGVVFLDHDFTIRRFTPQIAKLLELDDHDIGRPIGEFKRRLGHPSLMNDLQKVLQTQELLEVKVEVSPDQFYLLRIVPYRNAGGIHGVVLTMIDISSLRTAEAQLERFKFMTEAASDLIFLTDHAGRFQYVNPSMADRVGYTIDILLSKHLTEIDSELTDEDYQRLFDSALDGPVKPFDADWVRRDQTTVPVEVSLSSVQIEGDRFLCGSVRDVTERRKTELEMRLQLLAIEATHNGIIITDPNQESNPITYANPGFLRLTGYSREEVIGHNCRFLQGPETDPEATNKLREAINAALPCRVAIRNYRKDGTPFWNDLQITPVFDRKQRLVNFVGVQNDITERMDAQEALERANQEAKAASDAKSSFLANMSHELRTPMTAVLGFADMLAEELVEDDQLEKVTTIKRNGKYLLALLNDILDLSKIEANQMDIQQQTVDTRKLLGDVRTLMDVRATQEGIPLTFTWSDDTPLEVTADETRMRQVLVNLIGNALKFTDHGSVRVEIGRNSKSDPQELVVAVQDTGIGIHDSHLAELFTPFSATGIARRRRFGGTGLGLSISKRLAEGMGGTISVESELGVGSCFTFRLPLTPQQAANNQAGSPAPAEPAPTEEQTRPAFPRLEARILLADDRRDIWRIGRYFLEKCGAEAVVVEDGLQAVEAVQRAEKDARPFDLILMDMQMPVMTGQEAIAEIRDLGVKVPIIALTADTMEGEREACLSMGCDDYFPKPIDGPKLMHLIAWHLQQKRRS